MHRSEFDGPPVNHYSTVNVEMGAIKSRIVRSPHSILQEADEITEDRGEFYGPPSENHACTAALVTAFLQRKYRIDLTLDGEDVCWFNILQKISREANSHQRDNLVDVAGFVKNLDEVIGEEIR